MNLPYFAMAPLVCIPLTPLLPVSLGAMVSGPDQFGGGWRKGPWSFSPTSSKLIGSRNHGTQRYREKRGQGDAHERRHRKVRKIHARFCLYGNLWFNGTVCKINGVGDSSSFPQAVHVAILHRFQWKSHVFSQCFH